MDKLELAKKLLDIAQAIERIPASTEATDAVVMVTELWQQVRTELPPEQELAVLQPHQKRVLVERKELRDRMDKLAAFFGTDMFRSLDLHEQGRLRLQLHSMSTYEEVLSWRIRSFK